MQEMGPECKNVHELNGKVSEEVLNMALRRKSFDNVSVILIGF